MWLFVGDLHLTDQSKDEYRFGIFDWIRRQQDKRPVAATFLAGDLTDAKDRHSATLVNKTIEGLLKLKPPVYICMGNHDYRDPQNPFFKFLNHISSIHFVIDPTAVDCLGSRIGLVPHCRHQGDFDASVRALEACDAYLVHQTFDGAIAESGVRLSGLSASLVESLKPRLGVYAGDVHKPQTSGMIRYVGCPYHVRFGDDFDPSCVLLSKGGNETLLYFDAPRKWALKVRGPENILNNEQLYENDQVKLTIQLTREEAVDWKSIKAATISACKEKGLHIFGVKLEIPVVQSLKRKRLQIGPKSTNGSIVEQFCTSENLSSTTRKWGLQLLAEGKHGN